MLVPRRVFSPAKKLAPRGDIAQTIGYYSRPHTKKKENENKVCGKRRKTKTFSAYNLLGQHIGQNGNKKDKISHSAFNFRALRNGRKVVAEVSIRPFLGAKITDFAAFRASERRNCF